MRRGDEACRADEAGARPEIGMPPVTTFNRREAVRLLAVAACLGMSPLLTGCGGAAAGSDGSAWSTVSEDEAAPAQPVVVEGQGAADAAEGAVGKEPADVVGGDGVPADATPADTQPARSSELSRMLDAGEVSSILLIGDSITAGYGCDGYDEPAEHLIYEGDYGTFFETPVECAGWANDFRAYAMDRGVASFTNAGISGAKMWWLAEEPEAWIREGADVIFVMLGTNDAVYSTPEEFRANAESALAAVAGACRLMVVLSPPTNARTDAINTFGPEELDRILTEICDTYGYLHVSLIDALALHTDDLIFDQLHPTSSGSHKLWERIRTELGL